MFGRITDRMLFLLLKRYRTRRRNWLRRCHTHWEWKICRTQRLELFFPNLFSIKQLPPSYTKREAAHKKVRQLSSQQRLPWKNRIL